MAKDPAFLFYTSDFLTGTFFMSNEQIGIYIKLLCCQHQHGGLIDKITFNSMVGENHILRQKFIETEQGYFNERLATEVIKREKKSSNMSETAKDVWKQRKCKNGENVDIIDTNVKKGVTKKILSENENEDEIVVDKNTLYSSKDSNSRKKEFLTNQIWKEQFCIAKGLTMQELEKLQVKFVQDCDLRGDFVDNFKKYFTNWFNKNPPTEKLSAKNKNSFV